MDCKSGSELGRSKACEKQLPLAPEIGLNMARPVRLEWTLQKGETEHKTLLSIKLN